jgi:DNA-binding NtrC family response regulator
MAKVIIIDSSERDAKRFRALLADEALDAEIFSAEEAQEALRRNEDSFAAAFILWDLPGPVSGFDILREFRRVRPEVPVVVMSSALDASMATRAYQFGARDFLEKPLDSQRIRSCIRSLLFEQNPDSQIVSELRDRMRGDSPALLEALRKAARAISDPSCKILIVGESGTGKEVLARAVHDLGGRGEQSDSPSNKPWVAVNIGEVPTTLVESALFGHEKGAFTDARNQQIGLLEQARAGTIFLDEVGDLEPSVQTKLLRVIQEREFRRLGGADPVPFRARLVCATNRDLLDKGLFRRELYHRIAEVTVRIPPLRERKGDIDLLLNYFLGAFKKDRPVRFARESLAIIRSYPFFGNVREIQNMVRAALIDCDGDTVLPRHLPLLSMGDLLADDPDKENPQELSAPARGSDPQLSALVTQLAESLPKDWLRHPYREVAGAYNRALDRLYLKNKLEQCRHNVTRAAREAGLDTKTFRKRWKECGLPALGPEGEDAYELEGAVDTNR